MNDIKNPELERNKMNLIERLYLPEIAHGMFLVLKRMFWTPKPTRQYPEQRWEPTGSYRGRPVLVKEHDVERCVACGLCARVCPPMAIHVQAAETTAEKERHPATFEINMLRCIFCGFCEEACPEEAIVMSKDYEIVFQSRQEGMMDMPRLLKDTSVLHDRLDFIAHWK
jgi:NADH-quinone oxidoreductase subunit I